MDLRNAPWLWMRRIGLREPPRRRVVVRAERPERAIAAREAAGEAGLPERLVAAEEHTARLAGSPVIAPGEAVGERARVRVVAAGDATRPAGVRATGEATVVGSERSASLEAGCSAGVGRLEAEGAAGGSEGGAAGAG